MKLVLALGVILGCLIACDSSRKSQTNFSLSYEKNKIDDSLERSDRVISVFLSEQSRSYLLTRAENGGEFIEVSWSATDLVSKEKYNCSRRFRSDQRIALFSRDDETLRKTNFCEIIPQTTGTNCFYDRLTLRFEESMDSDLRCENCERREMLVVSSENYNCDQRFLTDCDGVLVGQVANDIKKKIPNEIDLESYQSQYCEKL